MLSDVFSCQVIISQALKTVVIHRHEIPSIANDFIQILFIFGYKLKFYFYFRAPSSPFILNQFYILLVVAMAPKKVEPEMKPIIGRIGTNLKVGIVGVPVSST